jgi:hypothetical protein
MSIGNSQFLGFITRAEAAFEVAIPSSHPALKDHVVVGRRILPGVAHLDLAAAAARMAWPAFRITGMADCLWTHPLEASHDHIRIRIALRSAEEGARIHFEIHDEDHSYAQGWILSLPIPLEAPTALAAAIRRQVAGGAVRRLEGSRIYEAFSAMGINYGPYFRRIRQVDILGQCSVARLSGGHEADLSFTNLLDCAFQSGMAIAIGSETGSLMPFSLGSMVFHDDLSLTSGTTWGVATEKFNRFRSSLVVFDAEGRPVLSVMDLGVKPLVP